MSASSSRFSIVDATVLVFLVFLGIGGVLIPMSQGQQATAPGFYDEDDDSEGEARKKVTLIMQNNTQIRGIHQSLVMFAQSNNSRFPGLGPDGSVVDASVEYRYKKLLDGNYFAGDYCISPVDEKEVWTTGAVTSRNYSYAMLEINSGGGREAEWSETLNTEAAVMSDRNINPDANGPVQSLWTDDPGDWGGGVAWNDNHVQYETSHVLAETQYGRGAVNLDDDLFKAVGTDDAMMIYEGVGAQSMGAGKSPYTRQ